MSGPRGSHALQFSRSNHTHQRLPFALDHRTSHVNLIFRLHSLKEGNTFCRFRINFGLPFTPPTIGQITLESVQFLRWFAFRFAHSLISPVQSLRNSAGSPVSHISSRVQSCVSGSE